MPHWPPALSSCSLYLERRTTRQQCFSLIIFRSDLTVHPTSRPALSSRSLCLERRTTCQRYFSLIVFRPDLTVCYTSPLLYPPSPSVLSGASLFSSASASAFESNLTVCHTGPSCPSMCPERRTYSGTKQPAGPRATGLWLLTPVRMQTALLPRWMASSWDQDLSAATGRSTSSRYVCQAVKPLEMNMHCSSHSPAIGHSTSNRYVCQAGKGLDIQMHCTSQSPATGRGTSSRYSGQGSQGT